MNVWIKTGGVYGGCGATWTHTSGVQVQHCGHPTALRPYTVWGRQDLGAFRHLGEAKAAAINSLNGNAGELGPLFQGGVL